MNEMTFFSGEAINYLIKPPIVGMFWLIFLAFFFVYDEQKKNFEEKITKQTDGWKPNRKLTRSYSQVLRILRYFCVCEAENLFPSSIEGRAALNVSTSRKIFFEFLFRSQPMVIDCAGSR